MNLKSLKIEGYKSIGSISIENPEPFSVFVGPNAAGKSNIFEAIELFSTCSKMNPREAVNLFGGAEEIFHLGDLNPAKMIIFSFEVGLFNPFLWIVMDRRSEKLIFTSNKFLMDAISSTRLFNIENDNKNNESKNHVNENSENYEKNSELKHFLNLTRLFVGNKSLLKQKSSGSSSLALDASNLEKVLKRLLKDETIREELLENLQLLIPGFDRVEIATEPLSGSENLLIYEQSLNKPLPKHLISDGTFNIIAMLVAVYQSDEPQFLCIEEPENGLNPKVLKHLVQFFRDKCKEKGHYIWLNTHSQTIVSELTTDEIILVDKVEGQTQIKQVKGMDLHGMKLDEALMTNALGGGIPW